MLGKKLLTIGCVAGILLCGACWDIRRQMLFVHTVLVEVADQSSGHELDAPQLRDALVTELNNPQMHSHLHAVVSDGGEDVDATLSISILHCGDPEGRTISGQSGQVHLECSLSISLTRKSGASMWKAPHYSAFGYVYPRSEADSTGGGSDVERQRKAITEEMAIGITRDLLYKYVSVW